MSDPDRSIHQILERLVRLENALPGIYTRLRGVEDELMSVNERLSPPDTASLSDMSIRAMEEKSRTKDLPPDIEPERGNHPFDLRTGGVEPDQPVTFDDGETDGDLLARLGTDAVKWAEEFMSVLRNYEPSLVDNGTLTSWFASAIETGRSAGQVDENGVDWKMRATAAETELALAREDTAHVANADRIRLAKDALMSSGYFDEGQVDDEIAPRIRELIDAHNSGFLKMQDDLTRQINKWKDRVIIAERKLRAIKSYFADLDVTSDDL